jgi:hypothetical protein
MMDRRRWPRHEVGWSVLLFVTEADTIVTHTLDAGLYGVRLAVSRELAARVLRSGETYRFEVHLPGQARFTRLGEVRHVGEHGVGLYTFEALPELLIHPPLGRSGERAYQVIASPPPRLSHVEPAGVASLARRFLSRLTARA